MSHHLHQPHATVVAATGAGLVLVAAAWIGLFIGRQLNVEEAAAQAAYDACVNQMADVNVLRLDGNTVHIEVAGEDARVLAGASDVAEDLATTQDFDDDDLTGLAISMSIMDAAECLVDETGYPGTSGQLTNADEWHGWRFEEVYGPGAEVHLAFVSTQ